MVASGTDRAFKKLTGLGFVNAEDDEVEENDGYREGERNEGKFKFTSSSGLFVGCFRIVGQSKAKHIRASGRTAGCF